MQRQVLAPHQSGLSLLAAMIGVGILGIVSLSASRLYANMFHAQTHAQLWTDLTSMKSNLQTQIDCGQTLQAQACTNPNQFFPLLDKNGNVIGGADLGTWKIGGWHYRAHCSAAGLAIDVARPLASGGFAKDALNSNLTLNWTWQSGVMGNPLYKAGEFSCTGSAAPAGFNLQTYTTPGTYSWKVPAGVSWVIVEAWGGGGGGCGGAGGAGGGGGYAQCIAPVIANQTYTVTVGQGGSYGTPFPRCGGVTSGSDSTFSGNAITCGAYAGQAGAAGGGNGGAGGYGTALRLSLAGGAGTDLACNQPYATNTIYALAPGGGSPRGGVGGAASSETGVAATDAAVMAGGAPGGGGAGACWGSTVTSGPGGTGAVHIHY